MSNEKSELVKNKETWNPTKLEDNVLLDDHRILHAWWSSENKGKDIKDWSKEDIYNAHKLAAKEMTKRKLGTDSSGKHASPLKSTSEFDQPFPAWKRDGKKGEYGSMIFLPNILDAFKKDYMLCEDFITVVGGLCNHGRTKGDIDILLKCPQPHERSPLGMAAQFRIERTLARIGISAKRIQFLYDEFSGPFTNHVHMYDLILRKKKTRELHEMSSKKVRPFKFVTQPKPLMGRHQEEIFTPKTILEVVTDKWGEKTIKNGIYVEAKRDGFRIQAHKLKNKVKILTEENNDVTKKLPTLVSKLKKINDDFVAEAEGELWLNNKHQNRSDANAIIQSKDVPKEEKNLRFYFYDIMWLNGDDIHSKPFSERHKLAKKTLPRVTKSVLVQSTSKLKKEIIKASKKPGSEGAMLKKSDYVYPLKEHTTGMIKYKNEFSVNVKVVEVHNVKGAKTKNYLTAIEDNNTDIPMGRTYNTDIIASVGDKIRVVFVELNKYIDPKTDKVWYNFWAPRVVGKADKIDSVKTAESLVKKSGGQVQSKRFPKRYKNLSNDNAYIKNFLMSAQRWQQSEHDFALHNDFAEVLKKAQPPVLDTPPKDKAYKFVLQEHIRGKSSHLDIRFEVNSHLIGFTLDDPGRVGDPLRFKNDASYSTAHKVLAQAKSRQPKDWLTVKGIIEPGEVGATKNLPAKFKILDKGKYEMGSQKANFLEVWLHGKEYKGRFVFRKLPKPSDSKKAGKTPFVWFAWKPELQRPYVLSRRAINGSFVPPKGHSALPLSWQKKIPAKFQWWKKKLTGKKAISMIEKARKYLLKRNILSKDKLSFTLQKKSWKGPKVVRDIPVTHYSLNLSNGISFDLDSNPIKVSPVNGAKTTVSKKHMDFEGKLPADHPDNPNKELPMKVKILDKGKVELIERTERFYSFKFHGSKIKGFWIAKTTNGGYIVKKSKAAAQPKNIKNTKLTSSQLADIKKLINNSHSLSDIARLVGCSKSSVIYHSQK